jgi:hypothetical protein
MENYKTKQVHIINLDYPFDSINQIMFKGQAFGDLFRNDDFKIKKFIGSDWSIQDSGFIFYGPNDLNIVFSLSEIKDTNFIRMNKYKITHFNGIECNEFIEVLVLIINNTTDFNTIVESRLNYASDNALQILEKYIKFSEIKRLFINVFLKIKIYLENLFNKNKDLSIINHSFIIKKNYKEAFDFFYNWNNMAKSIKTDKVWKIIHEDNKRNNQVYKDFTIIVNEKIKVHYHVISIDEIKDNKIEIVYSKTSNSFPSLNNYIKFSFFNISKEICFFLYETHLPINIPSSLYKTVSHYVYYCNKKSKDYIENNI